MSNHKFIQVEPPKEELTLSADPLDFTYLVNVKTDTIFSITLTSTVASFTGISVGDFVGFSNIDKETDVETALGNFEISAVTSVNEVETVNYNIELRRDHALTDILQSFRFPTPSHKLYKLPTNNFSLQVKTDSIVRYYEDPVDKTIMYLDLIESGSVCSITGNTNVDTYGEFQDYGGGSTLALTDRKSVV